LSIIETQQLTKTFIAREKQPGLKASLRALFRPVRRETRAVKGITFTVEEGERLAFIGPNGAGKSTTIKILVGILHPTSGQAQVLGKTPWRDRQKLAYEIGTVFGQKSQLWYHLPPGFRGAFSSLGGGFGGFKALTGQVFGFTAYTSEGLSADTPGVGLPDELRAALENSQRGAQR